MGGGGKGGGKGGGGSQTVGYRYFLGVHMGLVRGPIDSLVQINVEEKAAWKGELTDDGTIQINQPSLFGGDEKEGGIVGPFSLMMGKTTQTAVSGLSAMLRNNVPGFRGFVSAFFDGQLCANNPYPKPWRFRIRRARKGWVDNTPWYPAKAVVFMTDAEDSSQVIHGMNGAHILYECATNPEWGRGLPTTMIDEASFISAANALSAEGFGLCLIWKREGPLLEFMGTVVNHIGAALYTSRQTGLLTLRLLRNDYDPNDLPVFNYNSGLLQIDEDESGAQDNTANEIIVKFFQVAKRQERQVRAQNLASQQANGAVLPMTISFPGAPTHTIAARLAQRELRVRSVALKRFKLKLDRRGFGLEPGAVLVLQVPDRGIASMILRVAKIEEPAPTENYMTVYAVQDVFGMPATSYVQVQPSLWQPPDVAPKHPSDVMVQEVTYRELVRYLAESDLATVADDASAVQVAARAPSPESQDFELWSKADGESQYYRRSIGVFCPFATLADAVGPYDTTLVLDVQEELTEPVLPCAALLGAEIVRVVSIDYGAGEVTVERGCVDTVPRSHAAGASLMFYDGYTTVDMRSYLEGETVHLRLLTRTLADTYPFDTAADYTVELGARHFRPYPPANVELNGVLAANVSSILGVDMVFTWVERNRLVQADNLIGHEAATIAAEAGTTYNARVYDGATLLREDTGITGTTWTYTMADWTADGTVADITIEIESERDAVVSWTRYRFPLAVAAAPPLLLSDGSGPLLLSDGSGPLLLS